MYRNRGAIFLFEDNMAVSSSVADCMEYKGFEVYRPSNFQVAEGFLEKDPGVKNFLYFIVDLHIPYEDDLYLNDQDKLKMRELSKTVDLSGWVWLLRKLNLHPEMVGKTFVLSAYVDDVPEYEKNKYGRGIAFFDKTAADTMQKLIALIT